MTDKYRFLYDYLIVDHNYYDKDGRSGKTENDPDDFEEWDAYKSYIYFQQTKDAIEIPYELKDFTTQTKSKRKNKILDMKNRGINNLHPQFLMRFTIPFIKNIVCLDLSGNNIRCIADNTLSPLKMLKVLNLQNNRIKFIAPDTFKSMKKLKILNMARNQLDFVNAKWFTSGLSSASHGL